MPGELGNQEYSQQPGYYDRRYEPRVHQPDQIPKPTSPGLNKKIMEKVKSVTSDEEILFEKLPKEIRDGLKKDWVEKIVKEKNHYEVFIKNVPHTETKNVADMRYYSGYSPKERSFLFVDPVKNPSYKSYLYKQKELEESGDFKGLLKHKGVYSKIHMAHKIILKA